LSIGARRHDQTIALQTIGGTRVEAAVDVEEDRAVAAEARVRGSAWGESCHQQVAAVVQAATDDQGAILLTEDVDGRAAGRGFVGIGDATAAEPWVEFAVVLEAHDAEGQVRARGRHRHVDPAVDLDVVASAATEATDVRNDVSVAAERVVERAVSVEAEKDRPAHALAAQAPTGHDGLAIEDADFLDAGDGLEERHNAAAERRIRRAVFGKTSQGLG
jgi:hypothetical protein